MSSGGRQRWDDWNDLPKGPRRVAVGLLALTLVILLALLIPLLAYVFGPVATWWVDLFTGS